MPYNGGSIKYSPLFDSFIDAVRADGHRLTSSGLRITEDAYVVLSDADVERIARRVVELLKEAG